MTETYSYYCFFSLTKNNRYYIKYFKINELYYIRIDVMVYCYKLINNIYCLKLIIIMIIHLCRLEMPKVHNLQF